MSDVVTLADSQDRLLAETTWDRNVVVVAGAGTGKTTILVNRILNLLNGTFISDNTPLSNAFFSAPPSLPTERLTINNDDQAPPSIVPQMTMPTSNHLKLKC